MEEAHRNLRDRNQRARLSRLVKRVVVVPDVADSELPKGVELPTKDRPILLSAIEADATHLLTGDIKHFGAYFGKMVAGVLILPPADYLESKE